MRTNLDYKVQNQFKWYLDGCYFYSYPNARAFLIETIGFTLKEAEEYLYELPFGEYGIIYKSKSEQK